MNNDSILFLFVLVADKMYKRVAHREIKEDKKGMGALENDNQCTLSKYKVIPKWMFSKCWIVWGSQQTQFLKTDLKKGEQT